MKKRIPLLMLSLTALVILSSGLMAQEQTEVSVKVKKDGKVVKDTTYTFDDASEAKQAIKMMEVMSGDEAHMEHVKYNHTTTSTGRNHSKAMVFISEDGEKTKIHEVHGDSLVWISEGEEGDDHVKVMKYKIDEGGSPHGEHVVIIKSEDGNTFDVIVDKDYDTDDAPVRKEVTVVVEGDEDGSWTVVEEGGEKTMQKDVYVIKEGDDVKTEVHKIMKEHDGEEGSKVKVIVIEKDVDKDVDMDKDEDKDVEKEVEKKVVKKKRKK